MGLVGQDRGELHTRKRGISRRVTIQWSSHKSGGRPPLTGCEVQQALWFSAGGPTMTRDNGVRTVFTGCTSAAGDTRPIQPSEALKQCHDGRVAPGSPPPMSRQLIYWSIKRLMRSDQRDHPPRLAGFSKSLLLWEKGFNGFAAALLTFRNNPDQPFNPD